MQSAWILKTIHTEIKSGCVDKFHKLHEAGVVLFHMDIVGWTDMTKSIVAFVTDLHMHLKIDWKVCGSGCGPIWVNILRFYGKDWGKL